MTAAPTTWLPRSTASHQGGGGEAAARLFAPHGFRNVSVREITAEAPVNLASVNYPFGSKMAWFWRSSAVAPPRSIASGRGRAWNRR